MFNPAITSGVEIFVYIVIGLISFVVAITAIDVRRSNNSDSEH